jgi:hypothetical protein
MLMFPRSRPILFTVGQPTMPEQNIARRLAEAYLTEGPAFDTAGFTNADIDILATVIEELSPSDGMLVRTAIERPRASVIDAATSVLAMRLRRAGVPGPPEDR